MKDNVNDVIKELDRIHALCQRRSSLYNGLRNVEPELERGLAELRYQYAPNLPVPPETFRLITPEPPAEVQSKFKLIRKVVGIALAAVAVITLLGSLGGEVPQIGALLPVVGIAYLIIHSKYSADVNAHKNAVKKREDFLAALSGAYEGEKLAFAALLDDYYADTQLLRHKQEEFAAESAAGQQRLEQQYEEVNQELEQVTLLASEHHDIAGEIADCLRNGRADTFKEALNLAIAEERERQFREQQRRELEHQTEIMARQAAEERLHNQRMEQEAAARSQLAKDQLAETKRQNAQLEQLLKNQKK